LALFVFFIPGPTVCVRADRALWLDDKEKKDLLGFSKQENPTWRKKKSMRAISFSVRLLRVCVA
jgi:hypothetical protein